MDIINIITEITRYMSLKLLFISYIIYSLYILVIITVVFIITVVIITTTCSISIIFDNTSINELTKLDSIIRDNNNTCTRNLKYILQ